MSENGNLITEFMSITGSTELTAKHMLEACSNDLECAVTTFLDGSKSNNCPKNENVSEEEEVRAPIPQTHGVLIEDYSNQGNWNPPRKSRSVFDAFRNFKAEEGSFKNNGDKKLKRLEDLFRPPLDIMHRGSFNYAKEEGTKVHKWLMVNIQNVREFSCQALNRDVWSNSAVKTLVQKHFIFWQVYSDSSEGKRFMTFYNISSWPYVSILDPRTGGHLFTFENITVENIKKSINEFMDHHESLNEAEPPKKKKKTDILDSSEDSQLAAAIAASMRETKADNDDLITDLSDESTFSDTEEIKIESSEKLSPTYDNKNNNDENSDNVTSPSKKTFKKVFPKKIKTSGDDPFLSSGKSKRHKEPANSTVLNSSTKTFGNVLSPSPPKKANNTDHCSLMFRYPDGKREKMTMNVDDKLEDLAYVVSAKGYDLQVYELVTNFPRRSLSSISKNSTIKEAGLFPQETIFIQEKI